MKKDPVNIVVGMQVYSAAHRPLGAVEAVTDKEFQVNGELIPLDGILRSDLSSVYLSGPAMARYYREETVPAADAGRTRMGPKGLERPIYGPEQIQPGTEVYGSDDHHVGQVKATTESNFLVNRMLQRDLFIPYTAVLDASDIRVVLDIPAHEVSKMHWHEPRMEIGPEVGSIQARPDEVAKRDEVPE